MINKIVQCGIVADIRKHLFELGDSIVCQGPVRNKIAYGSLGQLQRTLGNNFLQLQDALVLAGVDRNYGHAKFSFKPGHIDLNSFFSGDIHHRQRDHYRNFQIDDLGRE